MSRKLFALLDQVQARWPAGTLLQTVPPATPPGWTLDAARSIVSTWSPTEFLSYRRQLPALAVSLAALYQRWIVAALLALMLSVTVVMAAAGAGIFTDAHAAVLITVVATIALPPIAICNGIARDYLAAQALLAVCGGVATDSRRS
jgi:hypothetical protein